MTQGEMFSDLALEQQYDNMIKELGMEQETKEPLNQNKMNTEKQIAVEWFFSELKKMDCFISNDMFAAYKEAKAMEKQQIIDAHLDGQSLVSCEDEYAEQYYNDTFKSE